MKTEYEYGYEYAKTDTDHARVDVDAILGGAADIPEDDYLTMRSAGIETPDAREYWRGYNGYCADERKKAAAALGRSRTPKKAAASRENGRKGGRPRNSE